MPSLKPIIVFGHWGAPNPWKVRILLEELGLPHEWREMEFSDVKSEKYLEITPNGRLPAIQDPNTGVALWEVRLKPLRCLEINRQPVLWSDISLRLVGRNHSLPDRRI